MTLTFDNSYARLPAQMFAHQTPAQVTDPQLITLNEGLAQRLGLDPSALTPAMLSGNALPDGATPIAQAYAGHQFGNWVPQLGDGRAVLLGEIVAPDGARFDMVLKGAGQTPFSRRGDGRAALGPVLREYVLSEAMAALGVPTTRALAAVTTGERVQRETGQPGAILTRVAASHIRVGTFQYHAARNDTQALQALSDHVIARHYPGAKGPIGLLDAVVAAQARLIAQWMGLGFIHGVMNTDNMAVSGETIDYGPCAFMDGFRNGKVFSSIDHQGRYAYGNQPQIAAWNLAQLAMSLLPLMGEEAPAIEAATASVHRFADLFREAWLVQFRAKLGLTTNDPGDLELIETLLTRMEAQGADFTRTFRGLLNGTARDEFIDPTVFDTWARDWDARRKNEPAPEQVMTRANPARIARNHQVEAMIQAAITGDYAPFHRLNAGLARPYDDDAEYNDLTVAPEPEQEVTRTFCGT